MTWLLIAAEEIDFGGLADKGVSVAAVTLMGWLVRHVLSVSMPNLVAEYLLHLKSARQEFIIELAANRKDFRDEMALARTHCTDEVERLHILVANSHQRPNVPYRPVNTPEAKP